MKLELWNSQAARAAAATLLHVFWSFVFRHLFSNNLTATAVLTYIIVDILTKHQTKSAKPNVHEWKNNKSDVNSVIMSVFMKALIKNLAEIKKTSTIRLPLALITQFKLLLQLPASHWKQK